MNPLRTWFVPCLLLTVLAAGPRAQGRAMEGAAAQDRKEQQQQKGQEQKGQEQKEKGWLGILLGMHEEGEGVLVTEVLPKSPAERGGLRADDVIRKVDGKAVADVETFVAAIGSKSPGTDVALGLDRGGEAMTIRVKLAARPSEEEVAAITRGETKADKAEKVEKVEKVESDRRPRPAPVDESRAAQSGERGYLGVTVEGDGEQGVVITKVAEGSPAAKAGLEGGDRIVAINDAKVDGWEALDQAMEGKKRGEKLSITVARKGKQQNLVATLSARPGEPGGTVTRSAQAPGKAGWLQSYDRALAVAKQSGKPVLIKFQADWCEPCHKLTEELGKPEAVAALEAFVPLVIDTDEQKDIADKFDVSGLPHVVALRADGSRIGEFTGWQPAEVVVQKLAEWRKGAMAGRQAAAPQRPRDGAAAPRRQPGMRAARPAPAAAGNLDSEVRQMREELTEIRKVLEKILERMERN